MENEIKIEDPMKTLVELENEATWLQEGERVEVIYGEFWKGETPRTDDFSGKSYKTKDFKIGCKNEKGDHIFRYVNKYDMRDILATFKAKTVDGKIPKTIMWERPQTDRGFSRRGVRRGYR